MRCVVAAVFGTLLVHQGPFTHGLRVSLLIAAAAALVAAGVPPRCARHAGLLPVTVAYATKSRAG